MLSRFSPNAIFRYLQDLGPGRVAVGVLVGLLLSGTAVGAFATDSGGARSAVADAIRPSGSDDDDVIDDALEPTPDGPGGDDGVDVNASPTSVASPTDPTETLSPTDTPSPISTPSPTPTLSPTPVPSPTSVPDAQSDPASPDSPASP